MTRFYSESCNLKRRLANKLAIVTAAGQGIGHAIAKRLVAEGAEVHVSDLNEAGLSALNAASQAKIDATDVGAVRTWVDQFERIDVVVHAVGYVHHGSIEECSAEDWRKTMNISLDSAFNVLSAAVPKMTAHGGSVVTISSVASSTKGFAKRVAYGAAKAGVIGLTKACAADYLQQKIRFNAVCPGTVDSPSLRERIAELATTLGSLEAAEKFFLDRQPSGRFGTPDEISGMCAYLASDDGRFVTGQVLNIDGGITI